MKKKISLLLVAALSATLLLAACGKKEETATENLNTQINNFMNDAQNFVDNASNQVQDIENRVDDVTDQIDNTPAITTSGKTIEDYVNENSDAYWALQDQLDEMVEQSQGVYEDADVVFVDNTVIAYYYFGDLSSYGYTNDDLKNVVAGNDISGAANELKQALSAETGIAQSEIKCRFVFVAADGEYVFDQSF